MFEAQVVQFGEWLPDQAALGNTLTAVKNAIPQAQSYSSFPGPEAISDAADGAVFAGTWGVSKAGAYKLVIGTASKLYSLTNNVLSDISKAAGYTVTNWEFIWWGDRIIAIGNNRIPQYYDVGTSTLFADLPNAPKATCGAVIGDFIVLGGASDNAALLKWSGFNNSESWTISAATQADEQELYGQGNVIKRIVPRGNAGIVFCERSIRSITYVGPPLIFRIDVIEEDKGTLAPNAIAWVGSRVFYYGIDGFYEFNGSVSQPIGYEKVDRFVRTDMDFTRITEMRAAIDRKHEMVVWTYPSLSTGEFRQLFYRWDLGKWGMADANLETVFDFSSSPVTVEALDSINADLDQIDISIDSGALQGGLVSLGGARASDHKVVTMTATANPLTAELETGELSGPGGLIHKIKSLRPLVDASSTLAIATRDNQYQNYEYSAAMTANEIGEMDCMTSSRYHRFKMILSTQFRHAQGVEVMFRTGGRR